MSQDVLQRRVGEKLQRQLRTASRFLDMQPDSARPGVDNPAKKMPADSPRPKKTLRRGALWSGLVGAAIALLTAVSFFSANNLFVSHLMNTEYSSEVELKFVIILLLFESGIIFAFAVQDRRRRKLEDLLRQSEDRLEFAAKSADLGLWSWDAATDSFWATEHCNEMFGIPMNAQFSMTTMRETVHPDDRAVVELALRDGIASRKTFEVEYRTNMGPGPTRWIRVRASTVLDDNGKLVRVSGTVLDVTNQRTIQAEVETQKQSLSHLTRVGMLGELSGALAHELNQPLTAIMSNAQAAQRMIGHRRVDMEELRMAIEDIIANNVRAGEVIRHLRALLKKEDMRHARVDLNDVARDALDLTHSDLIARRVSVAFNAARTPALVTGDSIQLQQLLLNLIMNAAEAISSTAHDGGMLILALDTTEDDYQHIAVSDTGPGIRADLMKNLFDPFFTTKAHGLGLGLSISRSIAEAHGGKMWAENNAGRGATFHVVFPTLQEAKHETGELS
jgi:C4-dicarboxylate-specific signal transduction histidine kinase